MAVQTHVHQSKPERENARHAQTEARVSKSHEVQTIYAEGKVMS